ncbi:MAG TPA: UDP-N-acetylmuramoyl-tripeptide--D-alanyl-D-alanine ligase [Vicinamibacterales bacterium]|nr:UDP-N-acetylmuramoyl-tripeptide--D-alanyl-D-alanine ligase [Vicinamibacterales bacterium]
MGAFVLTAGFVAEATTGRLVAGTAGEIFGSVSTDTRTLDADALFIALEGERFNGHDFLDVALERGATGLLIAENQASRRRGNKDASNPMHRQVSVIVVDDTLRALQSLARAVRRHSGAQVVAITGSAGKTTTKEVTAELLEARFTVFRNRGNLNNHIGLPLSLLELRQGPDLAVVELGMNHAGEIRTLVGIAEPEVRVWINVGDAHIGQFGSREKIAAAKAEILDGAGPETLIVANADDALVMRHVAGAAGRIVTFGESAKADVRATKVVDRGFEGTTADVVTPAGPVSLTVPLAGRAQLGNVLAAIAVATAFHVDLAEIAERVAALRPVARRGALSSLPRGVRVVDDSYNASPAAVQAMLATLASTPTTGRRIAVLGEMLELGDASRDLHEACGRAAAAAGISELVVIGGAATLGTLAGAILGGMHGAHIRQFPTSADAAPVVASLVQPGDLVLVKGSRGTRTDIVADRLLQEAS